MLQRGEWGKIIHTSNDCMKKFKLFLSCITLRSNCFNSPSFLHRLPSTVYRSPIAILLLLMTLTLSLYSDDFFAVKDGIIEESRFKLGFVYFTPLMLLENVGYTSSIYTYEAKDYPDWTGDFGLGLRGSAIVANRLILQAEDLPVIFVLPGKQESALLEQPLRGNGLFLCWPVQSQGRLQAQRPESAPQP